MDQNKTRFNGPKAVLAPEVDRKQNEEPLDNSKASALGELKSEWHKNEEVTDRDKSAPEKLRVFLSYSRQDMAFVDRLQSALSVLGITAYMDRSHVEKGEEWWPRTKQLITEADTIVFVLSPGSISSSICQDEIEFGESLNKRFIPIVARDITGYDVPHQLSRFNYIFFIPDQLVGASGDFDTAVDELARALETDITWIREHTRTGDLARRWDLARKVASIRDAEALLLRGTVLETAELWLSSRPPTAPEPTVLQIAFIQSSRKSHIAFLEEQRRQLDRTRLLQRRSAWALSLIALLVVAAVVVAAISARSTFKREATVFANISADSIQDGQPDKALRLALSGLPDREGALPFIQPWSNLLEARLAGAAFHNRFSRLYLGSAVEQHSDVVTSVQFSSSGRYIITASGDRTSRIWNAATGKTVVVLKGHRETISTAGFSVSETYAVTASEDGTARIWDVATGNQLIVLEPHKGVVMSAEFDPTDHFVVTLSIKGWAHIWDARTGKEMRKFQVGKGVHAKFNPTSAVLAISRLDGSIHLWDIVAEKKIQELKGHSGLVKSASFNHDGTRIVSASHDNTARVWHVETGRLISTLRGHKAEVTSASFSPSGNRIATGSADQTIKIWDVNSGIELVTFKGHEHQIHSVAYHPRSEIIVSGSRDGSARIWNARPGLEIPTSFDFGDGRVVRSVQQGRIGNTIVAIDKNDGISFWDLLTKQKLESKIYFVRNVKVLALNENKGILAIFANDWPVRIHDVRTGKIVSELSGYFSEILHMEFSPSGEWLLTTSRDKTVRIWNPVTGEEKIRLQGHKDGVKSASFSPNGNKVVSISFDYTAKIWDVTTGVELFELAGHTGWPTSVKFSPDGDKIITSSWDTTARIWDVSTKKLLAILRHKDRVISAAYSDKGNKILTVTKSSIRVWDVPSTDEILRIDANPRILLSGSFIPGGTHVIALHNDGSLLKFDLTWATKFSGPLLVNEICQTLLPTPLMRRFTKEESSDPVVKHRYDTRDPCTRGGPLSLSYWRDFLYGRRH